MICDASRMTRRTCLALLLALLPTAFPRAEEAKPSHFLWSVQDPKGGQGRVYLFGSLHLCRPDMYPLSVEVEAAYQDTKTLALEVNLDARTQQEIAARFVKDGLNDHGVTLSSQLQPETLRLLKAYLEGGPLSLDTMERMKPWFAAVNLTLTELQKLGLDPKLGLDTHFFNRAQADLKGILGLETPAEQLRLLSHLDAKTADLMLRQSLRDAKDLKQDVDATIAAWKAGDVAKLDEILMKDFRSPEFLELWNSLLVERNLHFAKRSEDFLAEGGRVFVVVGAGHLVGPQSVPEILTKRGYTVRQH